MLDGFSLKSLGDLLTNGVPWPPATHWETPPNMGDNTQKVERQCSCAGSRNGPRDHRDPECSLHFLLCTPLSPQPQWLEDAAEEVGKSPATQGNQENRMVMTQEDIGQSKP